MVTEPNKTEMASNAVLSTERSGWYRTAIFLAFFTVGYNLLEGIISAWLGYTDDSLTLFGFGVDSFIEVISGLGIVHMILRVQRHPESNRDNYEKRALRITGFAFYALVIGLLATAGYNLYSGHKPETTFWGIVISIISVVVMTGLVYGKKKVGNLLQSPAIIADANCTKVCIYMSLVLLASSMIYEATGLGFIDTVGALGLAWFSFQEGRECFEKAKSTDLCCC